MDFEALVLLHKGYSDMTLLQWMSNLNKNEYICNKFQTIWEICTNEKTNPNPSLKSETQIQIQVSNLRHKSKPTTESKIQIQIWIPNLRNKFKAKFRIYERIQIQIARLWSQIQTLFKICCIPTTDLCAVYRDVTVKSQFFFEYL